MVGPSSLKKKLESMSCCLFFSLQEYNLTHEGLKIFEFIELKIKIFLNKKRKVGMTQT